MLRRAWAEKHGPHTTSRPPGGTARRAPACGRVDPRPGGTVGALAIGPDGTEATLLDNLIFLRRHNRTD